jgi:hypothetical protein
VTNATSPSCCAVTFHLPPSATLQYRWWMQQCTARVTVLQQCYNSVTAVLQCYSNVMHVLQCYSNVTTDSPDCLICCLCCFYVTHRRWMTKQWRSDPAAVAAASVQHAPMPTQHGEYVWVLWMHHTVFVKWHLLPLDVLSSPDSPDRLFLSFFCYTL